MIQYIIVSKQCENEMKIIIGGATRKLAIEAFCMYNGKKGSWKGKYGGQRDFKIVRMKLTKTKSI